VLDSQSNSTEEEIQMMQMEIALDRGHSAARAAADKAEKVDPGWTDIAARQVLSFALRTPYPFTIEQARRECMETPEGADARSWGHVTRLAVRMGWIEPTGGYAPAVSSNGSPKRLYRLKAAQ
jgi:hypothetical protein